MYNLGSPEPHVVPIFSWLNMSYCKYHTRKTHLSVSSSQLCIQPQIILAVCSFSKTVSWTIWVYSSDFTPRPYFHNKDIPVNYTHVLQGHKRGDTSHWSLAIFSSLAIGLHTPHVHQKVFGGGITGGGTPNCIIFLA